jgi:hypothetical protein
MQYTGFVSQMNFECFGGSASIKLFAIPAQEAEFSIQIVKDPLERIGRNGIKFVATDKEIKIILTRNDGIDELKKIFSSWNRLIEDFQIFAGN